MNLRPSDGVRFRQKILLRSHVSLPLGTCDRFRRTPAFRAGLQGWCAWSPAPHGHARLLLCLTPSSLLLCPSQKWGLELSCTWENDGAEVRVCCDTVLCAMVPMTEVTRTMGVQRSWPHEPRGLQEWPCQPPLLLTGLGHFFLLPSQQCPNCLLEASSWWHWASPCKKNISLNFICSFESMAKTV